MIRKSKRSSFGGKLGEEFNAIWAALAANQIIPANGMQVKRTSTGTVLAPAKSEGEEDIINTSIGRYSVGYDGTAVSLTSNVASTEPWENHQEAWITDEAGRIIATPSNVDTAIWGATRGAHWGYQYQPPEPHPHLFYADGAEAGKQGISLRGLAWPIGKRIKPNPALAGSWELQWQLLSPYQYGEAINIVKLPNRIEIPMGKIIGDHYEATNHPSYSRYDTTSRLTTVWTHDGGGHLIWADYIDVNLADRVWISTEATVMLEFNTYTYLYHRPSGQQLINIDWIPYDKSGDRGW